MCWTFQTAQLSRDRVSANDRLHIDSQGQFFDRHAQPISRETALEHARHSHAYSVGENAQSFTGNGRNKNDLGINL
jgi:hypothetical protein